MNENTIVAIFHILFSGPLLIYVGESYGYLPKWQLYGLIILGAGVMLYHITKVMKLGIFIGWIYALHAFLFAPLLIVVGILGPKAFLGIYPVLTMLGFSAIGYHGMKIVKNFL